MFLVEKFVIVSARLLPPGARLNLPQKHERPQLQTNLLDRTHQNTQGLLVDVWKICFNRPEGSAAGPCGGGLLLSAESCLAGSFAAQGAGSS